MGNQDATVGTGAAGLMAIRVLLDHDVPEVRSKSTHRFYLNIQADLHGQQLIIIITHALQEHIIFLTFLVAPQGIHVIANAFPKVRIVTSMVDPALSADTLWIEPGLGNFGGGYDGFGGKRDACNDLNYTGCRQRCSVVHLI